jgi:hypothetical protein
MNDDPIELIIDTEENNINEENVFYMNSNRLVQVKYLTDSQFDYCSIKNTTVDVLTSISFSNIMRKLKPNGICEVFIYQPISVMQDYDAKQVEANAKLAGFINFEINSCEYIDKFDKKIKTLCVYFERPPKKEDTNDANNDVNKRNSSIKAQNKNSISSINDKAKGSLTSSRDSFTKSSKYTK